MVKRVFADIILILILLGFSWWLMAKSFGYETDQSQFRIARHEVGDFGLHLSLIRSFAWGNNTPVESPFFPGKPLMYHYAVDWLAGQLVRSGVRIDYALNGVSAVALTVLLYGLYRLGGILSIILFLLPGNLSFIEFFKQAPKDLSFFSYLWRFPDYLHKGPFDGSMITIYSTLAPYLNQRHLIAGMAIGITVIWVIVGWLKSNRRIPDSRWVLVGLIIGASTRVHLLMAGATAVVVLILLFGKKNKRVLYFVGASLLTASPHLLQILSLRSGVGISQLWNPGYLAPRPLSLASWIVFWVYNLGVLVFLIPPAYRLTNDLGRRLMIGAGVLFVVANTLQVSYRMEHNHSLINYATVIMLPFIAILLVTWWQKRRLGWKLLAVSAVLLATASGIFNLMVVKNDYQLMVDDAPRNRFMQWIKTNTSPNAVFLSREDTLDPVTLSGRRNYFGATYYGEVMGYPISARRRNATRFFEAKSDRDLRDAKSEGIDYIAIPVHPPANFRYVMDRSVFDMNLKVSYRDDNVTVYRL